MSMIDLFNASGISGSSSLRMNLKFPFKNAPTKTCKGQMWVKFYVFNVFHKCYVIKTNTMCIDE